MVLYEVFSNPELKRYKTSVLSRASIIQLICIVLTFLSPFLIAYFTGGFWIKEKVYMEKPRVHFEYRNLVLVQTSNRFYLSSTYDNLNDIYANEYLPATRTVNEVDEDGDGLFDYLDLAISLAGIPNTETVQNVKVLLLFNNTLTSNANLTFESVAYVESSTFIPSTQFRINGELEFFQTQKVIAFGNYYEYNYLLLNQNNVDLEQLNIGNILDTYYSRPYGTRLKSDYVSWSSPANEGTFDIKAKIRYPPYSVNFVPAFWEQFKWGWIQYIAILLPFLYVFMLIKIFIFENQIVPTVVITPDRKIKTN